MKCLSSAAKKSIFDCCLSPCVMVSVHSSPLAICWGGWADNSRTNRHSKTREAANEKSRRDSFVAYFKVEFGGHVSVQGKVKNSKLGAWTLEHRVGRLSSLKLVQVRQKVWGAVNIAAPHS